jgi:hypothetical protein
MGTNALGQPIFSSTDVGLQDFITRLIAYLKGTADLNGGNLGVNPGTAAGVQVWNGYNTFLGGTAEQFIAGLGPPIVKISKSAPPQSNGLYTMLGVLETIPASNNAAEWAVLVRQNNHSNQSQGSVGITSQAYKYGTAAQWGAVLECQDFSGNIASALVGLEIDVLFNGLATNSTKIGLNIVYGDSYPNSGNPSGSTVSVGNLIQCDPAAGIARFHALSALQTNGTYSVAALDLGGLTSTFRAMEIAGGARLAFSSGTGAWPTSYWYPGVTFTPTYVGALEIVMDGTSIYIPCTSNHP